MVFPIIIPLNLKKHKNVISLQSHCLKLLDNNQINDLNYIFDNDFNFDFTKCDICHKNIFNYDLFDEIKSVDDIPIKRHICLSH